METFHQGSVLTIEFTDEAWSDFEAFEDAHPNEVACCAQMRRLLERLGETGRLRSPDQWRKEFEGIWAVKARCGLRAYGRRVGRQFVICHVEQKKSDRMPQALVNRVKARCEDLG